MARQHFEDRPDEPQQEVRIARMEFPSRRTALTIGAVLAASVAAIAAEVDLSHPNRGKAIDPIYPNKTFDGPIDIPKYSFIYSRQTLGYFVPDGEILQHVCTPWVDGPPAPLTYGQAILEGRQHPLGVVLARNGGVQVLEQGQMVSVFDGSLFAGAGDASLIPTTEMPMTLYTPWSVRADVSNLIRFGGTYNRKNSNLAIVARTNYFKAQEPNDANYSLLPSSAVPADFQMQNGRIAKSPFNATIVVDGQYRTVVGRLHTVIGLYDGMLIESPDAGSIDIYNPINDGVWYPDQLCAQCPTDRLLGTRAWAPGGTSVPHTSQEGNITVPLFSQHDQSLSFMGTSLEEFFGQLARVSQLKNPVSRLAPFTYNNDWAAAKYIVSGKLSRINGLSKTAPPAISLGGHVLGQWETPTPTNKYIMNEQIGWAPNQRQIQLVQPSQEASL